MAESVHIFIDESGNAHLDLSKEKTPSHFVYTAVIIKDDNLPVAKELRNHISQKLNKGAPLKSSKLGNDDKGFEKRLKYLSEFLKLEFIIVCLVVDKSMLDDKKGGLRFHDIFIKFFNKIFLTPVLQNYESVNIYADAHGWPEFQESLRTYINKKVFSPTLFEKQRRYTYSIVEDKIEEPLIQYADVIAGSLGKIYCSTFLDPRADQIFDILHNRLIVDFFPYEKLNYFIPIYNDFGVYDEVISKISLEGALNKIEDKGKLSDDAIIVLKYLILIYKTSPRRMVEVGELIQRMRFYYPNFTKQNLRTCIQNLRDEGVLIASIQGKKGYKIPSSAKDILGFYNRYLNSIVPMIDRIEKCDRKLKLNDIDLISENPDFSIIPFLLKLRKK